MRSATEASFSWRAPALGRVERLLQAAAGGLELAADQDAARAEELELGLVHDGAGLAAAARMDEHGAGADDRAVGC